MQTDAYQERIANALIAAIEDGTAPFMKPWKPGELSSPFNAVTGHHYRGINPIVLMSSGFGDPRWLGFGQAKRKGGAVRKGEKGTPILRVIPGAPVTDKNGNTKTDADGNEICRRPGVKVLHVFHVSQVDGIDFPTLTKPEAGHDWDACERAEQAISGSGVPVQHVRGDRAFYRPQDDRVTLPERDQFADALGYYHTALHEIGHATGHASRLDRPGVSAMTGFGTASYAREELIAEITALMAGEQLGTGSTPQHGAAYVGSWIKALKDDPAEIIRAATAAQKAADWIVEHATATAEEVAA